MSDRSVSVWLVGFQAIVGRRHMVRRFTSEPVPQPSVDRILANAVRGPSAGFCQGQALLVLIRQDLPWFWAIAGEAPRGSVQTAPLVARGAALTLAGRGERDD